MPELIDNRAASTDHVSYPVPTDPNRSEGPSHNGTANLFLTLESPAWGRVNRRRAELIRRKVRGGLSQGEDQELEWLQRETLAAVDRVYPHPPVDLDLLVELEKQLDVGEQRRRPE